MERKMNIGKTLTAILFAMIMIASSLAIVLTSNANPGDDYHVYSNFNPDDISDVTGAGGYVEDYGVPGTWGDEIQFVYFLSGTTGYKVKVWVTNEGSLDDPTTYINIRQHPDHPSHPGPIEPRHFEIVSSADLSAYVAGSGPHTEEFYIDSGGVYVGAYPNGIHKWDHSWNYIGKIANSPTSRTESIAYNPGDNVWYAGGRYRTIYQLSDTDDDGSFMDESWVSIFTYPSYGGSHHDGMEYVGGYLWISDMTSDFIGKWQYDADTRTWVEINRYTYTEAADVEGMGFGPNDHFWVGSGWGSNSYIYELGNEISMYYPIADAGEDAPFCPPTIPIMFDGSGSHHTDPAREIVLYEWDFDGDGIYDDSGTNPVAYHAYPAYYNPDGSIDWYATAQTYTAVLRVTDDDPVTPKTDIDTRNVDITPPPWSPVADPGGPYNTRVNHEVCLDGSGSFHPATEMYDPGDPWYDEIVLWDWDLDNDGEFDDATGEIVCTQWSTEGTYFIGLRVTDMHPTPGDPEMDVDVKYTTVIVGAIHDIAVISVIPSESVVYVGEEVIIDVIVSNLGDYTESFDVTVSYDGVLIGVESVTNLDPGQDEALQFPWDTTGVPEGEYIIEARADIVPGEYIVDNNILESNILLICNIPPVADANGPYSGNSGENINLDGSGSSDSDGTIVSYEWDLDDDGSYDDATGMNPTYSWGTSGSHPISLKVTDDDGATDTDDTTVYINFPPTAYDDSYTTDEDTSLTVASPGVLENDADPEDDPLTSIKVTDPSHGSVTLNSDGSFEYIPDTDFCGSDTFTYKANDGNYDSNVATVTINVNCIQDPPVANDDYYSTNWHTSLDVAAPGVLENDADPDGDSLTANKLTNPSNGVITAFNSDGSFEYVPDSLFVGSDSFTYEADDGNGGTDTATVHITVIPPTCQDEVWVDDNYHSGTPGWFIDHFYHMQDAMYVISANGIVHVMDGTYQEDIVVDVDSPYCIGRSNLLIQGEDLPVDDNTRALIDGTIEINTDLTILEYFWFMSTTDAAVTVNGNDAILRNNVFDHGCDPDSIGVYATEPVNAEYNWWGAPNGPNGGLMNDGTTADGYGVQVIGSVDIEPWVGVHAEAEASSYSVETGKSVIFNAAGSFAADFGGTYEPVYYWTFEPTMHSNDKQPAYIFDTPGTYEVSLRVRGNGIGGLHSNFMYDWAYLTITVTSPGAPLSANADGGNLGGYETIVGEPVQLSGLGSGGTPPYSYSWNLGDGRTSSERNPTVVYEGENTYTVTLTVTDSMGATASDTAQVSVYGIDDLIVSIGGPYDGVAGTPMYLSSSVVGGVEPYTYSWDLGDGTISDLTNPTHTYENEGTYTVTLTVTDDQGTIDTDTTVITVEEQEEEAVIGEIRGGFGIKTTIGAGDSPVSWSIEVNGRIFLGGQAGGTIPAHDSQTVKLPFSFGLGKVNIIITANSVTKEATAFMIGPFVLSVKELQ